MKKRNEVTEGQKYGRLTIIKELKEALDSLDITNKYRLNLIRAIEYLQEEPVSEGRDIFDNCLKSEEKFILPQKISGNIDCENCLYSSACALGDIQECIIDKSVSEDLEKASIEICSKVLKGETTTIDGYEYVVLSDAEECFKAGAKWQKEQFEKNRLKHCDSITNEQAELESDFIDQHLDKYQRMPTFLDAIEYGMRVQKEQMMKDAVERTVKVDAGGYPYIDETELYDYDKDVPLAKEGDKYKVILIKED